MRTEMTLIQLDAAVPLCDSDKTALKVAESKIETARIAINREFRTIGETLREICDSRLYRDGYATFEDYVEQRWDISRSRAYQLIEASKVAQNVHKFVDIPNEGVAREIAKVGPRAQKKVAHVLKKVQREKPITATVARKAVEVFKAAPRGGLAAMAQAVKAQPEIELNEKPRMTPIAKAQAQAMIQEWYQANSRRLNEHPAATPETMVRRIVALFS